MKIITNNVPRWPVSWYDLSKPEQSDFDYRSDPADYVLIRYRGEVYDLGDFIPATVDLQSAGWRGMKPITCYSAIVCRVLVDGRVILGMATW